MVTVAEARNLSVTFGDRPVVTGFSLLVERGTATALTGPNGSGKTTVLRCLAGVQKPTEGTVQVLGRSPARDSIRFRRAVACLLDDIDFLPGLSVVQNLELVARAHGRRDANTVARGALEELGIPECASQEPSTLSTGQRHRLALGTTLVRPAELYIFDEPEQRLDVDGVDWLARKLDRLCADGAAVALASPSDRLIAGLATAQVVPL